MYIIFIVIAVAAFIFLILFNVRASKARTASGKSAGTEGGTAKPASSRLSGRDTAVPPPGPLQEQNAPPARTAGPLASPARTMDRIASPARADEPVSPPARAREQHSSPGPADKRAASALTSEASDFDYREALRKLAETDEPRGRSEGEGPGTSDKNGDEAYREALRSLSKRD